MWLIIDLKTKNIELFKSVFTLFDGFYENTIFLRVPILVLSSISYIHDDKGLLTDPHHHLNFKSSPISSWLVCTGLSGSTVNRVVRWVFFVSAYKISLSQFWLIGFNHLHFIFPVMKYLTWLRLFYFKGFSFWPFIVETGWIKSCLNFCFYQLDSKNWRKLSFFSSFVFFEARGIFISFEWTDLIFRKENSFRWSFLAYLQVLWSLRSHCLELPIAKLWSAGCDC